MMQLPSWNSAILQRVQWRQAERAVPAVNALLVILLAYTLAQLTWRVWLPPLVVSGGGPVQAQGVLALKSDGSYQFSGAFGARDATLASALQAFGPAGADGKIALS
ncbi:MAG: hypothetical protein O2845_03590 [Proteobacteria bacterium]|nr:hypothetical protein [Pseudomonadota bacterium]